MRCGRRVSWHCALACALDSEQCHNKASIPPRYTLSLEQSVFTKPIQMGNTTSRYEMKEQEAFETPTKKPSRGGGSPSPLSLLPLELQRNLYSLLNTKDAIALSRSCVFLKGVAIRKLKPDRHLYWSYHHHGIRRLPMVANLSKGIVHSVTFCAQWKKGNAELGGLVCIVALRRSSSELENGEATPSLSVAPEETMDVHPYGGGKVVAKTTKVAPNEWEHIKLNFTPREGYVYYLNSFGHAVCFQDVSIQNHVCDSTDSLFSKTFQVLHHLDVVSCSKMKYASSPNVSDFLLQFEYVRKSGGLAFPSLVLRLIQQGLANLDKLDHVILDPILQDMLRSGLPINEVTLQAAKDILESFIDDLNSDWNDYEVRWAKWNDMLRSLHEDEREDDGSRSSEEGGEDHDHEDDRQELDNADNVGI